MKNHPFIQCLEHSEKPYSPFVKNFLFLYANELNRVAEETGSPEADFEEARILQGMVYSATAIHTRLPQTMEDWALYETLIKGYTAKVQKLISQNTPEDKPESIISLALHRCFLEKLTALRLQKNPVLRCILNCCWEIQQSLKTPDNFEPTLAMMMRRYQEVCNYYITRRGKFGKFLTYLRDKRIHKIEPFANKAVFDPEHPFVTELWQSPQTPFVSNMLRFYAKALNHSYEKNNDFLMASALQTAFNSALSGLIAQKFKPTTERDHTLFVILSWRYYAAVNRLKNIKNPSPLECSALAIHLYFSHKHATFVNHKNSLMSIKLGAATRLQELLTQRMLGRCVYESTVQSLIDWHAAQCLSEGAPEGQFGLLARMVLNDAITSMQQPSLENAIAMLDPQHLRAHLNEKAEALHWHDYFNKRWLGQLADDSHQADYYQAWSRENPYQHATSMALRSTAKYTLAVATLALAASLVVAAAMGGIGGLVALSTFKSFIETMPGLYALGITGTALVSMPLSYLYNRKECSFKQRAIEDCIRFEPSIPQKTMT